MISCLRLISFFGLDDAGVSEDDDDAFGIRSSFKEAEGLIYDSVYCVISAEIVE